MSGKSAAKQVWGASPAGTTWALDAEPGTKEFFDRVRAKRSTEELPWLRDVVGFDSFADRDVLEIGCGAGYDAFDFCEAGARYVGVDLTPENIERTRKHLALYGYAPEVLQGDAEALPFPKNEFDLVFSNGVLHHTPDMFRSFEEALRVLRPGGRFCVIVYHRDSVFFRMRLQMYDQIIKGGRKRQSDQDRLSEIEYTTSDARPLVNVYSRSDVKDMLVQAGFRVDAQCVRKLVRDDFPLVIGVNFIVSRVPQGWLDALGRLFGWYVITWATKPEGARR